MGNTSESPMSISPGPSPVRGARAAPPPLSVARA